MADRTSQPATQIGVNPIYTNARFLWNAAVPLKNSLNNADAASGLKGTDNTGTAGKYRVFGADGQMSWSVTLPTGAYTLVIVHAYPTANIEVATTLSMGTAGGVRLEPYTSGGGVYEAVVHTAVGSSQNTQVTGVGSFNSAPWVEVIGFTGAGGSPANQLRRYRKSGLGVNTGSTETLTYVTPTGGTLYLGSPLNSTTQGIYAILLVEGDLGDAECRALRDNPWRMFDPADPSAPTITTQPSNATVTAGATASFSVVATGASSYQWQRSTNSGGSWTNVGTGTGGTTANYTTAATSVSGGNANSGDQYRCACTNVTGTTYSNAATLTVNPAGDTTPPTLTGTITVTSITQTSYSLSWPTGSDNVAVTGYEVSLDGGSTWLDNGNSTTRNVTGRTAGTTDQVRVRAYDAAGYRSTPALSTSVNLLAPTIYVVTAPSPVKNNQGTVLASTTIPKVAILRLSDMALIASLTNQTTNGSGGLSIAHASLAQGVTYVTLLSSADGSQLGAFTAVAA